MPGDDISLSVNTIKHFYGKLGEKYTFQKKSTTPSDPPKSQNLTVNEIVETITMTDDKLIDTLESLYKVVGEENLLSLFDQNSDWLSSTLN